jgi:NADH:ubiquinone oxidoreductase subunit 2 (subunit N)
MNIETPAGMAARPDFPMAAIQYFFLRGLVAAAILTGMAVAYVRCGSRGHISLRVFLRLTAMDVCCGPPSGSFTPLSA